MVYFAETQTLEREPEPGFLPDSALLVRETTPEYGAGEAPSSPVPDPFDDAEALEELEEEITTLAAHIHAATHRLLVLIADFDRREGWKLGGHRSCAHWLHVRTGMDLGAAREKVRTARVLVGLPRTSACMARGQLSFSKVRALSRVATPDNERELLELARGTTTAELERMVRAYRLGSRAEEADRERVLHDRRCLSVFPDEEGMYVVKGRLTAEVGALLMRAVEAAGDALYREEAELRVGPEGVEAQADAPAPVVRLRSEAQTRKEAAQRRADALGLLAERALGVGFGSGPVSGSRAERYQVVLHVEPETLEAERQEDRERRVRREMRAWQEEGIRSVEQRYGRPVEEAALLERNAGDAFS